MSHREGSASSTSGARREELEILSTSSGARRTTTASTPTIVPTSFITQSTESATTSTGSPQSTSSAIISSNSTGNHVGTSSSGNRKTIIVLATLMTIVGCLLIAAAIWTFVRCRRRRTKLFARGITPIGDDEIETWKGRRTEKGLLETDMDCPPPSSTCAQAQPQEKRHQKTESATSLRKPPSVIVYARKSDEFSSPTSPTSASYPFAHKMSFDGVVVKRSMDGAGKTSFDKELPFTPIQARAPNAREGLTDEAIPGDEPFVGSPRRRGSRLSKQFSRYPHQTHARNKSSRSSSSLHRLGGYGYESDDFPRPSHDFYRRHSRVSSSHQQEQQPPRLSLSDDWPSGKVRLSAQQLPVVRAEDIGRAIG